MIGGLYVPVEDRHIMAEKKRGLEKEPGGKNLRREIDRLGK